ncbi:hypothetical protein niasHT_036286 [Heterodera trifolii]|uniref:Uncharacterized protein n=1 Tax=Heterodera trifolii TaxID=157864 RepID=A0ABD2I853_9BILA
MGPGGRGGAEGFIRPPPGPPLRSASSIEKGRRAGGGAREKRRGGGGKGSITSSSAHLWLLMELLVLLWPRLLWRHLCPEGPIMGGKSPIQYSALWSSEEAEIR